MNDLLHRHAELLAPVSERLLRRIGESEVVLADETTIKLRSKGRKAWMWTFLAGNLIGYRFSNDRSGKTPQEVQAVYRLEHDAKEAGISQTAEHLTLRQQRAGPAMAEVALGRKNFLFAGPHDDSMELAWPSPARADRAGSASVPH